VVIGSMADLEAATLEDVKAFFRTWYAPANATIAVVGDFDEPAARSLLQKYFGALPSGEKPKAPEVKPVRLEKEVVIRHQETIADLARVDAAWHTPAIFLEGDATADVLASILSDGKASRLYRRLVHEKQLAQSVVAYQQSLGAQSVFDVQAVARPGVSSETLLKELDAVLAEVRTQGVTAEEIQRAVNRFETRFTSGLQKVGGFGGKADVLQKYNHYLGNPGFLAEDLERYRQITPEKVVAFAREQLDPARRAVLHAVPPPASPAVKEKK